MRRVECHSLQTENGSGSWDVLAGMLTVRTANGTKTAWLGGLPSETLAEILMRELAAERGTPLFDTCDWLMLAAFALIAGVAVFF
jgi:hypothetical protein